MAHNVEHWRGLGICCCVRPADALIKERNFSCNHQTSQQTKSVAKSAGGLENVKPKTEEQQRSNAQHLTVRPNFANALLPAVFLLSVLQYFNFCISKNFTCFIFSNFCQLSFWKSVFRYKLSCYFYNNWQVFSIIECVYFN